MVEAMVSLGRNRRDGVTKLSGPPLLVLTSLASGPKHGYALMKDIEAFAGVRLGPGTLHGAIGRLQERELIVSLPDDEHRRPYRITAEGVVMLREVMAEMGRVVEEGRARLLLLPEAALAGGRKVAPGDGVA
jgi:DNA-binding PadR family transcriptional regulator